MFGSIGIGVALSALSTVSSLIEAAAAGIGKAAGNAPPSANQTFSPTATAATAAAQSYGAPKDPGVVFPKFDERTQAALLALQEQHRGA